MKNVTVNIQYLIKELHINGNVTPLDIENITSTSCSRW